MLLFYMILTQAFTMGESNRIYIQDKLYGETPTLIDYFTSCTLGNSTVIKLGFQPNQ